MARLMLIGLAAAILAAGVSNDFSRRGAVVARRAHNPKVVSSNLTGATRDNPNSAVGSYERRVHSGVIPGVGNTARRSPERKFRPTDALLVFGVLVVMWAIFEGCAVDDRRRW